MGYENNSWGQGYGSFDQWSNNEWGEGYGNYDQWFDSSYNADNQPLSLASVDITGKPELIDAFWCDSNYNRVNFLDYGETKLRIRLIFNGDITGVKFRITIKHRKNKKQIMDSYEAVKQNEFIYETDLNPELFKSLGDYNQQNWSLIIEQKQTKRNKRYTFPLEKEDYLNVNVIRFIPQLMAKKGWEYGSNMLEYWFNGELQENHRMNPRLDYITMDWILRGASYKKKYDGFIARTKEKLTTQKLNSALFDTIGRMIEGSSIELPGDGNPKVEFGLFGSTVCIFQDPILNKEINAPHYHEFRIDYKKKDISGQLDDHAAAIGSCRFFAIPIGELYVDDDSREYKIRISDIGVYVGDKFDFAIGGIEDRVFGLGGWDIVNNTVKVVRFSTNEFYRIKNHDFRDWRALHRKGGDFHIWTDVKINNVGNIEIAVPKEISEKWKES